MSLSKYAYVIKTIPKSYRVTEMNSDIFSTTAGNFYSFVLFYETFKYVKFQERYMLLKEYISSVWGIPKSVKSIAFYEDF